MSVDPRDRRMIVMLDERKLIQCLNEDWNFRPAIASLGLPGDAWVMSVYFNHACRAFELVVCSEAFEPVTPGALIQVYDPVKAKERAERLEQASREAEKIEEEEKPKDIWAEF